MTTTGKDVDAVRTADLALKARHRAMWATGDYPLLASEVIADLGPRLVSAAGVAAGQHVLDVAAGSGNAAIPAALTGARVTASDLTPELFDAGRAQAARRGATLDWEEADAEALPYADAAFDVVLSCVGAMFAPRHQTVADELVRVCRPGGTIALLSWTPEGFIGQMFATMRPYAPAPPPGASPPPLWGSEDHVRTLLGDRVEQIDMRRQKLQVACFESPASLRDYFKSYYGPTIAVYRNIADDPAKVAALDTELVELAARFDHGAGPAVLEWEYLLVTARRT